MTATDGIEHARVGDRLHRWVLRRSQRRNALTPAMLASITQACQDLRGEIVVISGEGPTFCAGFDLDALRTSNEPLPDAPLRTATEAMATADATFVAAIAGPVVGAGVELVSACDLALAVPETYFEVPAARLGVVYSASGIARITGKFGLPLAKRLLLLGERVEAPAALQAGALLELCEDLESATQRLTNRLLAQDALTLGSHRDALRALASAHAPAFAAEHERRQQQAFAAARRQNEPS